MRLVTFNFKKINIEKFLDSFKGVKINTKINISKIEVVKSEALTKKEGLIKVNFSYNINYDPDVAKIDLKGKVLLVTTNEQAKEIEEMWKKQKMTEDFRILLFNIILRKSNIKALELEEQLGLPLHIPLPTLKKQQKEE